MLQTSLRSPAPDLKSALSLSNSIPLIVAHRGEWSSVPENTIAAIKAAHDAGAHMVEIDVQAIADDTLVVFHDETLDRMTGATGPVRTHTLASLRALPLRAGGGGMNAPLTEHCIPTLEEVLTATRGGVFLNIDTKYADDLDQIAEMVRAMDMADQVLIKLVADPDADNRAILGAPWFGEVPFMPILPLRPGRLAQDTARIADAFRPPMIEIMFDDIGEVAAARALLAPRDVRLWINTIDVVHPLHFSDTNAISDPDAVWGVLIETGVGALQTDVSAALAAYLGARAGRTGQTTKRGL